jgi:hypothetical protein
MWKPAFCAGFQALRELGESPTLDFSTISSARHFHSDAGKPAKSAPLRSQTRWRYGSALIRHIPENRLKCALHDGRQLEFPTGRKE